MYLCRHKQVKHKKDCKHHAEWQRKIPPIKAAQPHQYGNAPCGCRYLHSQPPWLGAGLTRSSNSDSANFGLKAPTWAARCCSLAYGSPCRGLSFSPSPVRADATCCLQSASTGLWCWRLRWSTPRCTMPFSTSGYGTAPARGLPYSTR